jgi:hypothetical protein
MSKSPRVRLIHKEEESSGFILPLVVILGFIIAVGGFAMLARSFAGLFGSTRQEQARQARELAETGLATTIEKLNREYNYLLINCYSRSGSPPSPNDCVDAGTWSQPQLPSSICPDAAELSSTIPLETTIPARKGRYRVEYYAFRGTKFYGGTGKLKVTGERLSDDSSRILATSAVELTFDVKPKPCDARFGDPASSSGFPGLMAKRVDLGNNDIEGELSGNILCTDIEICDDTNGLLAAVGAGPNAVIDGNIYLGAIDQPPVPIYPSTLPAISSPLVINNTAITIKGGDASTYQNGCESDGSVTHCAISSITLSGTNHILTLDTTNQPIRLYVSGNITISGGKAGIEHIRSGVSAPDDDFARVGLFGIPAANCSDDIPQVDNPQQVIRFAGLSSGFTKLFAFFPCGEAEIMGSPGGPAITGVLWAWDYDASASNVARLSVPDNAGSILLKDIGAAYSLSVRDYVALGINSWRGFQGFSQ